MCYSITAKIPIMYAVACMLLFSMQQKIKKWIEKTKQKGKKETKTNVIIFCGYCTRREKERENKQVYCTMLCYAVLIQSNAVKIPV